MTARRRPLSWPQFHTLDAAAAAYRDAWQDYYDASLGRRSEAVGTVDPKLVELEGARVVAAYARLVEAIDALGPAGP